MEKWKVIVIILLIGALGGYGAYQSVQSNAPMPPPPPPPANTKPQPSFVGKHLPPFHFPMTNWDNTQKPVQLSDLKGSVALVEIFRITCSHCQAAAPVLVDIYKKYTPRGLKMVSIQAPGPAPAENDWQQVQATIKTWGFQHPVAFDENGHYFKNSLGGQTYPSLYILDKNGVVVYQQGGETDEKTKQLLAKLDEMLPK